MEKCLLKTPTKISFKSAVDSGNVSHRRRSTAQDDGTSHIFIEDLKLGEQFSMALSNKGIVYTWGQNDKGQLGLGNEISTWEPQPVTGLGKLIQRIDSGLKHCVALTKSYELYAWGSNL
jgi:alpha-tubulin suppressor-like RCC1 family protein